MIKINKKLKKIAIEMVALEKLCQKGDNVSHNMDRMAQLISELSLEEMLAVDDYIMKEKLLTQ